MNKMHIVAKTAAGILGIYLLISTFLSFMRNVSIMFISMGKGDAPYLITAAISLLMALGFMGAVFYFLIYRSDIFAQKVVGKDELPNGGYTLNWFPFAMRLTAVVIGFLFLGKAIVIWDMLISRISFVFRSDTFKGVYVCGIIFLIYLAVTIYLLCGAPHFVRWQVKKTLELCKEFSDKQDVL